MNFAGRLKISSFLPVGVMLVMIPVLVWSFAGTKTAGDDDNLAGALQRKAYERTLFRDEYLLYQEERSREQWLATTGKTDLLLRKAAGQLTDNAERKVLAEMRGSFDETVAIFGRILEQTEKTKKTVTDRSFHDTDQGKRLYSQLLLRASSLQEATFRLQKLTERRLEQANNRSIFITALFVMAIAVATAVNALFLNRTMRRRLENLHAGARTIADGNLDFRIDPGGSDEFADLATTINTMTERVQGYTSELQKSESSLRGKLEELSQIYQFTPAGLFAVDRDMRFLRINERLAEINGKPVAEHLGRTIDEVLPADLAEALRKIWQPVLERGDVVLNVELQGTVWWSPDVPRHWLANYFPLRSGSGDVIGLMGSVMDITDRKLTEDALQESEERYRAVVEDQTEVISRLRADGTYSFVNDVFCRFFGKTREELLGRRWQPDAFPDDVPIIEEQLRTLSPSHPVVVIENRVRSGSGAIRWMQFVNRGFFDHEGRLVESQAVGRDITDRKNLELKLAESEQKFRALTSHAPVGIFQTDPRGKCIYVNNTWCQLTGLTPEEALGAGWSRALHPEDRDRVFAEWNEAVLHDGIFSSEYRFMAPTGTIHWVKGVAFSLAEAASGISGYIGSVTDITERKQAEDVLANARNMLERQVAERTDSLSQVVEQLRHEIEERKRMEQELLDYQHRLESLNIDISLAEERERDRIAGELHDQVGQRLILGKMKLDALANRLPSVEYEKDIVSLEEAITHSIQDIRSLSFQLRPPLLASAGLEAALQWLAEEFSQDYGLQIDFLDDRLPKPLKYEIRSTLFQAVRELLLNVVKHADATCVRIVLNRVGDRIVIVITDNGAGFDALKNKERAGKSGGFGLPNVERRIVHLGGSFEIASSPCQGTQVTISVPLQNTHDTTEGGDGVR